MEGKEVEETITEPKPHPPRFTKLTRNISNSASESYVKSLLKFADYIYELKYSKESELHSIDSNFFTNTKLYSVTFPPSLTVIDAESMSRLKYLYEILFLKNDEGGNFLEKIGYKAFYNTDLESIIIPNNILNIESNCFPKCLKSIEFEKGAPHLQKVGDFSFSKTQIEEFKMPLKINPFLDTKNHFLHCYKLNKIVFDSYVDKEEPPLFDFPKEDEDIKKWQNEFTEDGQNLIVLDTIERTYNILNDDDYFIERKTLDSAWNCTLSQIPNLKSLEVFNTNLNNFYFFNMPNLTTIQITEGDNGLYIKHKGCLYTKDKKKLIVAERNIENTTILANCQLISNYALNVKSLEKVTFEGNSELQEISVFAFAESNIKEINIPDSVQLINYGAFYNCSLEQINIPKSLNLIEIATFSYSKLTKIKIPNSIVSIEIGSFYKCSQLKEVEFEEDSQLRYINDYAFAETKIESISIPKSVERIGNFCFINCTELKKIDFDDHSILSYIGDECFKGTMIDDFQIPQNIESYDFSHTNVKTVTFSENSLFTLLNNFQSSTITHVNIPPSVSVIKNHAFADCVNLTKVAIIDIQNSKLELIDKDAFCNCSSLEEFEIPKSVKYFGINSFKNCSKYNAQITIDNDDIIVCENAFENSGITVFKSKCQKLSVNNLAFNNCINLVQFSAEVEKSIKLGSFLFMNCKSLFDVKLNMNTEKAVFCESCFMNTPIKSINIPKNLKQIPKECFKNCQNLIQVTIDKNSEITIFDVEAFSGSGINSILIPSKTTIIDEKCFKDCSNLKKVTFSNQLQNCFIKNKAFYNSGIQQLNIPKGIGEIDESCFKKCSNLTKLTFANDILFNKIKKHTFQSSGIKSLILPPKIIFIKKSAFKDCKQLQNVTFHGEANVSKNAFTGCDKLQTVKCDNSIIIKTLNVPKVLYQSPIYFRLNQQQIDGTFIKAIMTNSEPFFQHFQRYDFQNTLVFNMESRFNNLVDCYTTNQYFNRDLKYQIIEYKEGGYYSNLMKNLLFCDFSTKEITVSKDTEVIESKAFKYSNLRLIEFEENSLLQRINSFAFEFLRIEDIEIPDSVIYIGDYAFSNCYSLRRVSINQTSNLSMIGKYAFAKTAIKTILFPSTLRTVSEGAFYECYMLTQVENHSNEINFGYAAFYRSSIENIDFPAKSIFNDYSFNNCKRLKKISFSDNKEKALFGEDSFSFSGLEEIEIKCDAEIHTNAFSFCSKLKKITLDGNIICSKSSFYGSNLQDCTLNFTQEFDKDPLLCYSNIIISNIDKCSLKYCENAEFNLRHKCYVFNNTLEYADLIDNFSLTKPYRNESKRTPIKKNEILRVPSSVKRMNFPQMSHIKLIIFPSNCLVEDLGPSYSFSYCNLIEITIPKLVQKIPPHCFEHCHYLRTVKFEEESILDEIGEFSFSNTRVRKVNLPNSVKIIRNSAFSNNLDFREVTFNGEIIEDEAFSQTGITSFTLSNNTKSIGSKAFQYCSELKTFSIDIDNSNLSEIGTYAFLGTSISSINIPPNVKAIKSFTFDDCQCLENLNISMKSELEEVDEFSFSIETNLKKITIPKSILNLFNKFIGTPSLLSDLFKTNQQFCVIESQENPENCSIVLNFSDENTHNSHQNNCYVADHELIYADLIDNAGLFEPSTPEELDSLTKRNEVLAVPVNTKKLSFPIMSHIKRILWSSSNIVEDIGPSGFFSYYNLIQITIPKSVQVIPPHAFDHCHYLSTLVFEPKSQLKEIGEYSFSNTRIKAAYLPNSVQIIHKAAFANNLDLEEVSFIGEIIEDEAFSHTGLTSFILSNNTKSIGSKAFQYCRSLETFSINIDYSSLSEIGTYAFSESSIISINIPPNVKTIKSFTFSGCNLLKVVNISTESSLEKIEEYSFAENLSLKFINIPKTIKNLSFEAFINTPSLQSIMKESNDEFNVLEDNSVYGNDRTLVFVPRFLKQFKVIENCLIIHSGAFCGPNLEEVIFMDNSLMCIEKCAFAHTNGLKRISIPNSIQFIGEEAFIHCENLEIVEFDKESQILEIPKFCFAFSGLKAIILPSSIEFINQSSFYFCRYLTNVNLNDTNVKYIGDYAFSLTKIEEVRFPSSIEYIGSHSFEGNKSIKLIDLTKISHVEETNPNQFKEFKKLIYKSHKKILKLISNRIKQQTLTENEINEHNENIRNEMPQVNNEPTPPTEDINKANKSPRRKAKFNGPKIEIKSSPYLMLKDVPKVFKPNPYINKKVSKIKQPFDTSVPAASANKKKSVFPPPPPLQKKEQSPRRYNNKNKQTNNITKYQSILPPEAYEDEYSQDFTENTENSISNEVSVNERGPQSPKCYIHKTAFCNSAVKMFKCNFEKLEWFSFYENCHKIGKFIVNSNVRFRLQKLGTESNYNNLLSGSLFRITKIISNDEPVPLLTNQLLTEFIVSKSVKFLNNFNFAYCSKLTSITFENDIEIKKIPAFCFAYSSLKEISIPISVQSINKYAFLSCSSLEKVNFTRGNNLRFIKEGAFCECSNISSIHISKNVEKIGKYAFYSCTNLQKVSFSDGSKLNFVDNSAFSKCSKLNSIKLPEKLKVIGKDCFSYTGLTSIQIPHLIEKIEAKTFYHCEELSKVTFNERIKEIGEFSFSHDITIKTINIPDSIEIIQQYAFSECYNLRKLKTSTNTKLVEIHEGSFEYTQIEELNINSSARILFSPRHVNKLKQIKFQGGPPSFFYQTKEGNIYEKTNEFDKQYETSVDADILESKLYIDLTVDFIKSMYYYSDKLNIYSLAENEDFLYRIDPMKTVKQQERDLLISRNRNAQEHDKNRPILKLVFAPKNSKVLTIHEDCFTMSNSILDDMNNLTTIEYEKGITNCIRNFANYNHHQTNKIREIKIQGQYCHLDDYVFSTFKSLERVEISSQSNITYIPKHAFEGCSNLREIIIPSSCFSIEESAFKDCIKLQSFLIKESDTKLSNRKLRFIKKEAFYNCSSLQNISIPPTVYAICEGAFMNCVNLETFLIEELETSTLEIIEKNAFKNCKVLSTFHLPTRCVYIGTGTFMNCINMKTFEYEGSELQSIESRTFYNCRSLNRIEFTNLSTGYNYIPLPNYENSKDDEETNDNNQESIEETLYQKYKRFSKSSFYIGSEAFRNCISLYEVIIEDQSKNAQSIKFDDNGSPSFIYPPQTSNQIHDFADSNIITKRQTIQRSAFINCRSLSSVRIFLGNLESIQTNAFKNCYSLVSIEINSQFWRYLFSEALDLTSFIGTPETLEIKIFNKNKYSSLMIDLSSHPKVQLMQNKQQSNAAMAKSLPENTILSTSITSISNNKNKTFEIPKEQTQNLNETNRIKEYMFMENIHLYLSRIEKENVDDFCMYLSHYKDRNIRWDIFESLPFLKSQPLNDLSELTNVLHASNFPSFYELTEVIFGDDMCVDMIPDLCFSFTALNEISIPSSVEKINKYAFYSCVNLQKVSFPIDSKLKIIDDCAFSKCSKLDNIILPDQLETIGKDCFSYTGLTSIQIPHLIEKIEAKTFYHCEELSKVTFNERIKEIGEFSFSHDITIRTINIPDSIEIIQQYAFSECYNLRKLKTSTNTKLVEVHEGSFEYTQIEELNINSSARILFSPRHVNKLKQIKFQGGPPSFFYQTKEGNIYEKTNKYDNLIESMQSNSFDTHDIYQLILNDFDRQMNEPLVNYTQKSQEILIQRNRSRFPSYNNTNKPILKLVFAPKNSQVLKIHEDCFTMSNSILDDMDNLTTIEYKKGITNSINNFANYNHHQTNKIREIKIQGQYCHLDDYVFSAFKLLERIEISSQSNITYIPKHAFEGCSNLREIIIPSSCFSIEESAFKDCIKLKSFSIRTKDKDFNQIRPFLRYIKKEAFCNCSSLQNMSIPPTVYAICEGAFMNCVNLETFLIEELETSTLEIIEKNAFKNCKVLSTFHLPTRCVYIGTGTFMNCINMKTFEYEGSELQSIESRTFYNCRSLSIFKMKNLSYQSNYSPKEEGEESQNKNKIVKKPFSIGAQAFMNCTSLKKVVIEDKSKSIKTFEFDRNNSPIYLYPNHKYTNHRNSMFPRCQTVQRKAFCNCKSLLYVRLFLGNLERFQANAFKNCYVLKSIDINSQYSHYLLNEAFDMNSFEGDQNDVEFKLFNKKSYFKSFFNLRQPESDNDQNQKESTPIKEEPEKNIITSQKRHYEQYLSALDKTEIFYILSDKKNSLNVQKRIGLRLFEEYLSSLNKTKPLFSAETEENKRRHRRKRNHNKNKENEKISYDDLIWKATSQIPNWIYQIVILKPKSTIRIFKNHVSSLDKTINYFSYDSPVFINESFAKKRHFKQNFLTTSEIREIEKLTISANQNDSADIADEDNEIQNRDSQLLE